MGYDLIIIGGGAAGLTAGIYASRGGLNTLLVEKLPLIGGLARTTDRIENYPGFPSAITGTELMENMKQQAQGFGVQILTKEIVSVDFKSKVKSISTKDEEFKATSIIIATGTQPVKLEIPGEEKFMGRGVSYCATCDGPLFKNKNIVIVGCGNSGLQEGLFLLKFVNHITYIEFLPYMTGEKILQDRIEAKKRTTFYLNTILTEIKGGDKVEVVTVKNRGNNELKEIPADGVFIYAGSKPNTLFLNGAVELDKAGYIITNERMETSVSGIYAAGDVRKKDLRQVATAVSDGATAAFMAIEYIERKENL